MNGHFDNPNLWKWVCSLLVAFIVGMWTGQFTPNRNIATVDQISKIQTATTAQISAMQTSIAAQSITIQSIATEVSELHGELKGRNMLSTEK